MYNTFWMKICRKTLWDCLGPENVQMLPGPPKMSIVGNDCFSFANYNDQPQGWELNSHAHCTVHLFKFVTGDGGEIKECTLDVLNIDRGSLVLIL